MEMFGNEVSCLGVEYVVAFVKDVHVYIKI